MKKSTTSFLLLVLNLIPINILNANDFHEAVERGDKQKVIELLNAARSTEERKKLVNTRDHRKRVPLFDVKDPEIAQLLIDNGAEVNIEHLARGGTTAIHYAAQGGRTGVVRVLITHGADVNAKGYDADITPLHTAASKGILEMVKMLVQADSEVEAQNSWDGGTPLHGAARFGHLPVARYLVEKAQANLLAKESGRYKHLPVQKAAIEIRESILLPDWPAFLNNDRKSHEETFVYLKEKTEKLTEKTYALLETPKKNCTDVKQNQHQQNHTLFKGIPSIMWLLGLGAAVGLLIYLIKKKLRGKSITPEQQKQLIAAIQELYTLYQNGKLSEDEFNEQCSILLANVSEHDATIIMQLATFGG